MSLEIQTRRHTILICKWDIRTVHQHVQSWMHTRHVRLIHTTMYDVIPKESLWQVCVFFLFTTHVEFLALDKYVGYRNNFQVVVTHTKIGKIWKC